MKKETSEYYKTLADLTGKAKFEALEALQVGQDKFQELLGEGTLADCAKTILSLVENFAPLHRMLNPFIETHRAITQYLEVMNELKKGIHVLRAEGWYFSLEFIDTLGISNLDEYLRTDPAAFEADVIEAFTCYLPAIEMELTKIYPKRTKIITNILALHRAENYEAAIPMSLAQADGMCKDVFFLLDKDGKQKPVGFFDIASGKASDRPQKLAQSFELPETSLFNVLYNQLAKIDRNSSLLLEQNTIRLSDLNRHAIIHGESTDYGTRTNSIKAILLLDFILDLRLMDNVPTDIKNNPTKRH